MTSRERLLTALQRGVPDRLPVTTHHLMPSFLRAAGFATDREFFDRYDLDAIHWMTPLTPGAAGGAVTDPAADPRVESWSFVSDQWIGRWGRTPSLRAVGEMGSDPVSTTRYRCITPRGTLSMVLQDDGRTVWVVEGLIKEKRDIDLIADFAPVPLCDAGPVGTAASVLGSRGIVRGAVPGFALYGQPGCWQDAAVLVGIEALILATYDDPGWVLELLDILRDRKMAFLNSTAGVAFDLLELGGGDASSTVISPNIFGRFVAPFDAPLIAAAHAAGQRIVYHTCGGMMPLLERIADMQPDAMETFTPPGMGGDARLAEAKSRVGDRVCMIGGFDQGQYFVSCPPGETRRAVRACFDQAGAGGGFILAPSDHFFEADEALLSAFADEARACTYRPAR
jgi:uroporphyrinogen decarboxylase